MKTIHVPQYKNLSVEKILEYAADKPIVTMYLPDDIDLPKVPKQWLVNIFAVVLGNSFKDWVVQQVQERNALMCEKKEVMIAMDPEMAAKFEASTHVSRKYLLVLIVVSFLEPYHRIRLWADKNSILML